MAATCLCCSLRVGLIIYSSICCLGYIIKLGYVCYFLYFYTQDPGHIDDWDANIEQSNNIVQFSVAVACLLNCILLLLGAASKNENLLRPWLCFAFIILLTIFCNAIFQLYENRFNTFVVSTIELLVNSIGYSFVFCNFEELSLSNVISDDEGDSTGGVS